MMSVEYHWVLKRCTSLIREEVTANYDVSRISLGFRSLYVPNSRRSYCKLHIKFNLNIRYYGYHIS